MYASVTNAQEALDRLLEIRAEEKEEQADAEERKKNPPFVQLTKSKMPDLRKHLRNNPLAVEIFLFVAQHMGRENILICSLAVLMEETGKSRATVSRAVKYLKDEGLMFTVKFGSCTGYALDGNYVWTTFNHAGRHAVFERAKAMASMAENRTIIRKLATAFSHESPPLSELEEYLSNQCQSDKDEEETTPE